MHEYSVVSALVDRVEQEARARHAVAVHRLSVRIGELSGIEPQLLASAFELCREGTVCARAELRITRSAVCWECPQCGTTIEAGAVLRCPDCARPARMRSGDEIMLDQIEMEVP
jgi:hydrogenase nickel incorporation protein HypA/HybF